MEADSQKENTNYTLAFNCLLVWFVNFLKPKTILHNIHFNTLDRKI